MAGFAISTNANPQYLRDLAQATAQNLGFTLAPESDWSFRANRGSTAAAMFAGGLFIAYCRFRLSVTVAPNGVAQLALERNAPVWTGVAGVARVKNKAKQLAEAVAAALSSQGATVYELRPL